MRVKYYVTECVVCILIRKPVFECFLFSFVHVCTCWLYFFIKSIHLVPLSSLSLSLYSRVNNFYSTSSRKDPTSKLLQTSSKRHHHPGNVHERLGQQSGENRKLDVRLPSPHERDDILQQRIAPPEYGVSHEGIRVRLARVVPLRDAHAGVPQRRRIVRGLRGRRGGIRGPVTKQHRGLRGG